ncbi:hypothetical protein SAMN05428974_0629 [Sphingopyxis sp. YR583]|nr:hypothetical protein SAMN05428974_0629 [Sphingopyxis sp. YR583]
MAKSKKLSRAHRLLRTVEAVRAETRAMVNAADRIGSQSPKISPQTAIRYPRKANALRAHVDSLPPRADGVKLRLLRVAKHEPGTDERSDTSAMHLTSMRRAGRAVRPGA